MSWSWNTGAIRFDALCVQCHKPLRGDANIVHYRSADYHVGCLLDKLTSSQPEEPSPWGHFGMIVSNGNGTPP